MKHHSFLKGRTRSFGYAVNGLARFFQQEPNAWLHMVFTVLVIPAGLYLNISIIEFLFIIFSIGLVWSAEVFNTVIEKIMDHLSPGISPKVKFIKDLSAGAVLVSAVTAAIVGLIIFIPKIIHHVI